MFRLPDYILDALKDSCFLCSYTERMPEFGIIEQELVDLGYIEILSDVRLTGCIWDFYKTSISPKGERALLDNLHPSDLVTLIQDGVATGHFLAATKLVVGVPRGFLSELLTSSHMLVREAARERLDKLNGLERGTNWLACRPFCPSGQGMD